MRRLVNRTTGETLSEQAVVARSLWAQMVGFIARPVPWSDGVIGIPHCDRIHTFGVNRALDIVYCDRAGIVLLVASGFAPGQIGPRVPGAWWVWEAEANGVLAPSRVQTGHLLAGEP